MRISSSLLFQTGLRTIGMQQTDLMHLYQQIGTGQRMVTPADDPLAASQTINIAQAQSLNQRYAANLATASQNLSTEEDALGSLTLLLQDVRTRLVEAGNGALSGADRATLADVLDQARATMLGVANTTDGNGQYLFSGSLGQTPAYALADPADPVSGYRYQGDGQQRLIQADQTRRIAGADIGSDIFARAQPGTLAYGSQAASSNTGSGVVSQPAVVDPGAGNAASGLSFQVRFLDAQTYEVQTRDAAGAAVGTPVTRSLAPGAQALDLGFGTRVEFKGQAAAGDRFDIQPLGQADVNLFDTLGSLVQALRDQSASPDDAGLRNALNTAMQRMDTGYDNVLTVRASIGARLNELSALDQSGAQRGLGYAQVLSNLEDVDYYGATMQLSLRKMALEGAALAFQTIQGLSLFNMGGK